MSCKTKLSEALGQMHPVKSSGDNDHIADVIGNKTDESFSRFSGGFNPSVIGHLRSLYYHAHGNSFTIPDNDPVLVAPAAVAWEYGTPVLIGQYDTTTFDIHWVQVSDLDNNGYYNIELCNEDGTQIKGKTSCFRTNNFTQEGNVPIQVSPQYRETAIYARVAVSTGNLSHTLKIKLFCHPYTDLT